ncbi:GntR family transcriptional regulator [Enteractinococcus coprophilus]|uniref:DNA-binding GntR family transcriptional regulator n=1 Tax=Enteractinococcus coprophilus TaxID=1027633 RepID=A0A543AN31_9MICC|nr:GntR family transcriptional regulator [Enteractinococcus coprophilus]TQL73990.1 DNA-binding GntR family transcriptional regulator [Enteractinococcus coprophilus]
MTSPSTPAPEATQELSLTDRLRQDIVAGNLVPHQRLIEADVAEAHGASRGEVRLALNELITEGFVERIPNRGARVRKVSLEEAIEITEVRGAVESLCARKAAEKVTDEQAGELRRIGAAMQEAVERGARDEYSNLNRKLHTLILEIADQQTAAQTIARLRGQAIRYHFQLSIRPDRPQVSLPQHQAIIEAICARDPQAAGAAMQAHLDSVTEAIASSRQG